jgi:hypothetical protein
MNVSNTSFSRILIVATSTALLAACGGSDGDGGGQAQTGFLKVGITDAPVDMAAAVVVKFTGVELKPQGGPAFSIDFATPKSLDLIQLQGEDRALLLDNEEILAGEYEWMRLKVEADPNVAGDSYLQLEQSGAECEMRVPSGDQTGLKLIRGFTIGVGTTTDFTIDFDLRKSIVAPPGQTTIVDTCNNQAFMLKPVLRIVDNLQVGTIAGDVDPNLIAARCAGPDQAPYPGNVYLFGPVPAGGTVMPDDYDGVENDPNGADALTSAMVDPNTFRYTIGFVPEGNYRVAYTCDPDDAGIDADAPVVAPPPATGETVDFTPPAGITVTVTPNAAQEVDFVSTAG